MRTDSLKSLTSSLPRLSHLALCSIKVRSNQLWVPDSVVTACMVCSRPFNLVVRRHHCRRCGTCMCGWCSHMAVSDKVRPRWISGLRVCCLTSSWWVVCVSFRWLQNEVPSVDVAHLPCQTNAKKYYTRAWEMKEVKINRDWKSLMHIPAEGDERLGVQPSKYKARAGNVRYLALSSVLSPPVAVV